MNIITSILEGILIARFTSITSLNKNRSKLFLVIYTSLICLFSYLAFFYNLDSFISTFIIVFSFIIYNYNKTLKSFADSFFLGFTLNLLILIANGSTVLINYGLMNLFNVSLPYYLMLIISKILLYLLVEFIGKLIKYNSYYDNSKINLFNLSVFLLSLLYSQLFDGYFQNDIKIEYFLINIMIISILVIVIYKLFDNEKQNIIFKTNQEILEKEIEFQKINLKNIINNESETRKLRHNNKHLLLALKDYLKNNDLNNLENTINKQLDVIDNLKYSINTGNESIDFIISHYLTLIKEKQIDLICNYFKEQPIIDKLDFYIIFGNILENAIEHCNSNTIKKITIEIGETPDERYYFKIINSINTNNKIDLSISSKDNINHGYGIKSINELVNKNNGTIEYLQYKNNYCVMVLLPLKNY